MIAKKKNYRFLGEKVASRANGAEGLAGGTQHRSRFCFPDKFLRVHTQSEWAQTPPRAEPSLHPSGLEQFKSSQGGWVSPVCVAGLSHGALALGHDAALAGLVLELARRRGQLGAHRHHGWRRVPRAVLHHRRPKLHRGAWWAAPRTVVLVLPGKGALRVARRLHLHQWILQILCQLVINLVRGRVLNGDLWFLFVSEFETAFWAFNVWP